MKNTGIKIPEYTSDAFDNVEYELRISYTVETDKRVMTFVDHLWGIEVTGGVDQYEPLTVLNVQRTGLARRAGIRVGDVITRINETPTDDLTFTEAQMLIRQSGRYLKLYVRGDVDDESDDEYTVDFWFRPRKPWKRDFVPIQWEFPWNDRKKPIYKESNCYLVPSRMEDKIRRRRSASSNVIKQKQSFRAAAGGTRSLTPSLQNREGPANLQPPPNYKPSAQDANRNFLQV